MSEQVITGHQECPRCKKKTNIIQTDSFPFDDEYETQVEEKCDCGYHREVSFHSSNFTTAENHRLAGHHFYAAVESKTGQLVQIILDYAKYPSQSGRPSIDKIQHIMTDAGLDEFYEIYYRLKHTSEIKQITFAGKTEWINEASLTRSLGRDSISMDEYYDNEVRSEARNQAPPERAIDSMIDLLRLAELKAG